MNCQRCRIVAIDPLEYAKGIRNCPRCRRTKKYLPSGESIQEPQNARERELADAAIAKGKAEVLAARKAHGKLA